MNDLYSPTYLKQLCEQYDLTPSKKYGQNYLISEKPITAMIEAGELSKQDTVIEIGPGFGVLTLAMAPLVKQVMAFEIEKKLEGYWEEKQQEYDNVEVVWGNALKKLQISNAKFLKNYKVLANLPYQITSHAIRTILEQEHKPERAILMVQKEVADRIVATPGDMSLLSVSVQYYGDVSIVHKVSSGSFWPAPKVQSAIIAITNIRKPEEEEAFFRVVKAGFSSKRKQLWHNLSSGLGIEKEVVKRVLVDVCGNEKVRAQELSVAQWQRIVTQVSGGEIRNTT